MGSNSDNTKLATTAILAGSIGAALSYYLLHHKNKSSSSSSSQSHSRERSSSHGNLSNSRTSFIFQDPEHDFGKNENGTDTAVLMPHSHEERMRRRIATRIIVEDENSQPRQSVTVKVPATSANCGPGFDCIGLAVDLWTEVTVSRADKFEITAEGDGAVEMPKDETNLLVTGVKAAYDTAKKPMPPLKYHVVSRIPYARGLVKNEAILPPHRIPHLSNWRISLPIARLDDIHRHPAILGHHPTSLRIRRRRGTRTGRCCRMRWLGVRWRMLLESKLYAGTLSYCL